MSDSAEWRSVIDVIIPHSSAPRVLLLPKSGQWYLPRISIDNLWAVDVGQICHELRRTLGIATTVLRLASKSSDDEQQQLVMTYVSIITTSCAIFGLISNQASNHDSVGCFAEIQAVAHEQFP